MMSGFNAKNTPYDYGNMINILKEPTAEHNNASVFGSFLPRLPSILRKKSKTYADVSKKVLSSERVKTAIKQTVIEDLKEQNAADAQIAEAQITVKHRAVKYLQQMRSCVSPLFLKIVIWIVHKFIGRIFDAVEVRRDQMESLKKVSKEGVPIVYLPLHKSHLDYVLLYIILFINDLRVPIFAAGNNLMIPFFGSALKRLGAFYIKRKTKHQNEQKDHVYKAILHSYVEEILKSGQSLGVFIEGGRSRTGKAVLPKAGLLSILVDTVQSGGTRDAYIVPIAMSYEKLIDGNFVSEQLGNPKEKESFLCAVKAIWRSFNSNFGKVTVEFCHPFSLKEFSVAADDSNSLLVRTMQPSSVTEKKCFNYPNSNLRSHSERSSKLGSKDNRQLIKSLADFVVYTASDAHPFMSTHILAFLFLTKHRKGATFESLVNSIDWIREELAERDKKLSFFGDSAELINRASTLLGKNLITSDSKRTDWFLTNTNTYHKPSVHLPEVLELQYYANSVIPVFLLESVIMNAVSLLQREEYSKCNATSFVLRKDIVTCSLELCSILHYEFIFSSIGESICSKINATIDELLKNSLLEVFNESGHRSAYHSSQTFKSSDLYHDQIESRQKIKLDVTDSGSNIKFLQSILAPLIESYSLSSEALTKLIDTEVEEKAFLQEIKNLWASKLQQRQICYQECLGFDTLRNSFKLFESWKILNLRTKKYKNFYSLQPLYNNNSRVQEVNRRIKRYLQ